MLTQQSSSPAPPAQQAQKPSQAQKPKKARTPNRARTQNPAGVPGEKARGRDEATPNQATMQSGRATPIGGGMLTSLKPRLR